MFLSRTATTQLTNPISRAMLGNASWRAPLATLMGRTFSTRQSTHMTDSECGSILFTLAQIQEMCGDQLPSSLPSIATFGIQSAGKSETVAGMTEDILESKSGAATKHPTIINLVKVAGDVTYFREGTYGHNIYDPHQMRAIMRERHAGEFSEEPQEVTIFSPHAVDMQVIDLPGYIAVGQDRRMREMIERMNRPFLENPDIIKMLVTSATNDVHNSLALRAILEVDALKDTIQVVTKLDKEMERVPASEDGQEVLSGRARIIDLMTHPEFQPGLGRVGVRLRSRHDIDQGMTVDQMLKREQQFIQKHELGPDHLPNLSFGIPALMQKLSEEQFARVAPQLPTYADNLNQLITRTEENQKLLQQMAKGDRVQPIAVRMTETLEMMSRNSPNRRVFERILYNAISELVEQMVDAAASTHFPNLSNSPSRPSSSGGGTNLNSARKLYREMGGYRPNEGEGDAFGELTKFGTAVIDFDRQEMEAAYKRDIAESLATPFYQMEVTSKSKEARAYWMARVGSMIDDLINVHNLHEEARQVAIKKIIEFVSTASVSGPTSGNDEDSSLLFRYNLDKIEEGTNKLELARFISWVIAAEKRPILDSTEVSHELAIQQREPFHQHVGLLSTEEYPKRFPLFGNDWTRAYLSILKRNLTDSLYQMIGVNISDKLLVDLMAHTMRFFQAGNFKEEEAKVQLKLDDLREKEKEIRAAATKSQKLLKERAEAEKVRRAEKEEQERREQELEEKEAQKKRMGNLFASV